VQRGVQVTVFTTNANGPERLDISLDTPLNVDGVTVRYFPLRCNGLGFFYAPSLAQRLAQEINQFDLVAVETIWGHQLSVAARICRQHRKPYTIATRGQLFDWSLGRKHFKKSLYLCFWGRRALRGASALHCTDPTEAAAVSRMEFGPSIFVVPNGIDTAPLEHMPKRGLWRNVLGIPADSTVLLFLGRLTQIKRPDIAVTTLAACCAVKPATHLIFAGPDQDGLGQTLQAQASQLGCRANMHMTGLLEPEQVRAVLADSDLLVAPSEIQENFGMAAAEALAAGVPVLISEGIPVGNWAQAFDAGRSIVCDVEQFGHAAVDLIMQPEVLNRMRENGKKLAKSRFDIKVVASDMLRHYQSGGQIAVHFGGYSLAIWMATLWSTHHPKTPPQYHAFRSWPRAAL
jgi:glycosyltransferase involved in cell wall biosynthesis